MPSKPKTNANARPSGQPARTADNAHERDKFRSVLEEIACRVFGFGYPEPDDELRARIVSLLDDESTTSDHPEKARLEPGHTPGPWEVCPVVLVNKIDYRIAGSGWMIARVNGEANARLIARAPELLAALQKAESERDALREALESIQSEVLKRRVTDGRPIAFHACAPELRRFIIERVDAALGKERE